MRTKDILGKKFGRLTVINFVENRGSAGHAYWKCICRCGGTRIVRGSHLRSGSVTSCGCRAREVAGNLLKTYARGPKHKGSGNPQWKGDKAQHSAIHTWLGKNFEKEKCERCPKIKPLDFALIKGKRHSHKRKNYMILCRGCHLRYDREK